MNKPFKPESIVPILAEVGVSISDLKRNPAAVVNAARTKPVGVLNRNRAVAYVVSPKFMEMALDAIDDLLDLELLQDRQKEKDQAIRVTLDDLHN